MSVFGINHGDQKTRSIRRVRVRRDRRPSVVCAAATDSLPYSRRLIVTGCNGLGIAPVAAIRPPLNICQPNTRRAGSADIVNRRGSQRCAQRNRMAAVKKRELRRRPWRRFSRRSAARKYVGSPQSRVIRTITIPTPPPSVCRGGGQKSAILQFRPRHGAEGIKTKQGRSKQ